MMNRLTEETSEAEKLKRKYKKLDTKLSSVVEENIEQKELIKEL